MPPSAVTQALLSRHPQWPSTKQGQPAQGRLQGHRTGPHWEPGAKQIPEAPRGDRGRGSRAPDDRGTPPARPRRGPPHAAAAESDLTQEGTQDGAPQSTVWDHGEGCPAGCRDFCRPRQRVRAMARTWGPTDSRRSLCPANGFLKGGQVPGTGRTGDSDRSCSSARSAASPGVCAARQASACPPARRRACTPPSRRLPKDSCGAVSEFSLPCAPRPAGSPKPDSSPSRSLLTAWCAAGPGTWQGRDQTFVD